jgi:CheY-like chemotaxis protein
VQAHGGTVTADSEGEGTGATFTVTLPVGAASAEAVESAASLPLPAPATADTAVSLEGLRVLVVDDDELCRQVISAHLEMRRAVVMTAASVADALHVVEREQVDVLLSDIAMPGEDGYALIRRLRAGHTPDAAAIPAAALTAFARQEDRERALDAGFQMHLTKPIEGATLVMAVARLGGRLPERRQARASLGTAAIQSAIYVNSSTLPGFASV